MSMPLNSPTSTVELAAELTVRRYADVSELPPDCAALFLDGERESFDLSRDWFEVLTRNALPAAVQPCFYVLTQAGTSRAILPLLIQPADPRFPVASLTTFYSSLYRPLLDASVTSAELAVLLRQVVADTGLGALRLDAMAVDGASFKRVEQALRACGLATFRFFCFGNHYHPTLPRPFAEYYQERPSRLRNTAQRRAKKFLADGRGRLELIHGAEGEARLPELIQAWEKIYSSSWKVPEPYPDFMPNLLRLCAERGWLRFGLAYYDDQPIAAQLWIVSHGRAAIYKLAYDEQFAAFSAGTLLTIELMRHVMDIDGVAEVDYLIGDDAYKRDWMSHRRERWGIVAYNPWTLSGWLGIVRQLAGAAHKKLRGALRNSAASTTADNLSG